MMHLLVSNRIFVFVGEGVESPRFGNIEHLLTCAYRPEFYIKSQKLVSDLLEAFIAVGHSRKAIIVVLIVGPCLLLAPILFGL